MAESPVSTGPATPQGRSTRSETRGFLFADIRGYTQYVERQGAAAAADMLLRYRAIVRDAITQNEGAEIRTEGDSFYVVLRSASDAVLCGLAIVKGVAEENARNTEAPIRVGVGVHAGEAIDTAEGLVGSAVNVAARVCALAGPGEVLVTDTVRGLARSVIPVRFTSRGDQRLKGIAEPIELFLVSEEGNAAMYSARAGKRNWLMVAAAVAGLAALGAVYLAATALSNPSPTASPASTYLSNVSPSLSTGLASSSAAASPANATGPTVLTWGPAGQAPAHLHGGDYEFDAFRPRIAFSLDETKGQGADWWFTCGRPDFATISAWDTAKAFPGVGDFDLPDNDDPCYWNGTGKPEVDIARAGSVGGGCTDNAIVQTAQDLYEWLAGVSVLETAEPEQVIVAGGPALAIDTHLTGDVGTLCGRSPEPETSLSILRTSTMPIEIKPGDRARFILIDVRESLPLILRAEAPPADWGTALTRLQPVLDSMKIGD